MNHKKAFAKDLNFSCSLGLWQDELNLGSNTVAISEIFKEASKSTSEMTSKRGAFKSKINSKRLIHVSQAGGLLLLT